MKNILLSLGFLFISLLSFQSSFAQMGKEGDEIVKEIQAQVAKLKNSYFRENFKLNETESKAFWLVYEKYNTSSTQLVAKMQSRSEDIINKNPNTDEQKLEQMEYQMQIKTAELEEAAQFHKQLKEVLSAAKVLEYYKLEKDFQKKLAHLLH